MTMANQFPNLVKQRMMGHHPENPTPCPPNINNQMSSPQPPNYPK